MKVLPALVSLLLLWISPLQAAVLTINQVTDYAFNAGFRGGSLVSAIAAAEAESGFDTEAVNNNVLITTAAGVLLPGPDGKPVLASLPRTGRQMLPLGSIQPLGDGRYGRVVSHCRGLWQFNDVVHPRWPTDAQAFDPSASAACAWAVSRHGRDWGKWVVMQNASAWQSARLARARAAAIAKDFSVLRSTAGERAQARVTGGSIRATAAGTRIRALHRDDMGRVLAGPVQAAITQGKQRSTKLWWQVAWDSGHTGWVSEDLLIRSSSLDLQPAQPAYGGWPHDITGVPAGSTLTWCTGGNTASQKLYVGLTAALNGPADLKFTGLVNEWKPAAPLSTFARYYWRVDTISAQGATIPGPVWTFLTRPPEPAAVVLDSVVPSTAVLQPGFNVVLTCHTRSPAGQPVLVGASLHRIGMEPISDMPNDLPRFAPAGTGSFTRNFNLPLTTAQGNYTLLVRLIQDYNGNGEIDSLDTVITERRQTVQVAPPGPLVEGLAVSPDTMAPGQQAHITGMVTALSGSSLTQLKLFRAEGESAPGPWTLVQSQNMNNNATFGVSFVDVPPSIRRYWYALQAFDNLGRGAPDGPYFRPVSVRVTIGDHTPPAISWNNLPDGAVLTSSGPFTGMVADNDIVESAAYQMDSGGWQALPPANWSVYPDNTSGPHRLTISATDRSGNNNTQSRLYYVPSALAGTGWDEDLPFTGPFAHQPFWNMTGEGDIAVRNGRLEAAGDGAVASFFKTSKVAPAWARALEISYLCGPEGAAMTWSLSFTDIVLRVVPQGGQWEFQTGKGPFPQVLPLPQLPPDVRLSVFGRLAGDTFYSRVVTADATATVLAESAQTIQTFGSTTGSMTFTLASTGGTAWLDDVTCRALREENFLRSRNVGTLPPTRTDRRFSVDWISVPGRFYQLEVYDPLTHQWSRSGNVLPDTGLVTASPVNFPLAVPAAQFRVRQLRP